jgi:type IV secretory pathway VirB10-like protein
MMTSTRKILPLLMVLLLSACDNKNDNKVSGLPSFDEENKTVAVTTVQKKALPAPCSLVSVADAQLVVAQPMAVMSSEAELCAYQSAGQAGDFTSLMINLNDNDDEAMAIDVFRAIAGQSGKLNKMVNDQIGEKTKKSGQSLDGLGDEAKLNTSNAGLVGNTSLVVRKGTVILNISIIGMGSDPSAPARLEALARKIVVAL